MKDRLITIAGGLLAFALVVILLVPVGRDGSQEISRPLSTDRGRAGLEGLRLWIERGGAETQALRLPYTRLASDFELSPRGNLLIVSLPQHGVPSPAGREALRTWIAQGNSALVLIAAGDWPPWRFSSVASSSGAFLESFGFELSKSRDDAAGLEQVEKKGEEKGGNKGEKAKAGRPLKADLQAWLRGETVELSPRARHPLTRGVKSVSARAHPPMHADWRFTSADGGRILLPLLRDVDDDPAFWEARVGSGRLWVSRYSNLFANTGLGAADNARFMANLIDAAVGKNGRVIFDDMHQGSTDLYDARAFFSDPRFINTMLFMIAFWLLYLIGRSRRLAPGREAVSGYYAADLVRAMAGFFARRLSAVEIQRQLFIFFFNDIRARYGLPTNGLPLWSMLSGMSQVSSGDIEGLRMHYERASAGKKPDLVASARLMQRTRESLL